MNLPPLLLPTTPHATNDIKSSPRLLMAIGTLASGKFTTASVAKADQRHPGVPLSEMVREAQTLAVELKDTVSAIAETLDANDPQLATIHRILAMLE